jgi:hypothetical protein
LLRRLLLPLLLQVNATNAGNYNAAMHTGTAWLSTGLWAPAGEHLASATTACMALFSMNHCDCHRLV